MDEKEWQSSHDSCDKDALLVGHLGSVDEGDESHHEQQYPDDKEQDDSSLDHGLRFDLGRVRGRSSADYTQYQGDCGGSLHNFESAELEEHAPGLG